MPPAATSSPTLRIATAADIPAILTLLLTSFRSFSLFAFLYAPLETDVSVAADTVFFWRRRLQLEFLTPTTSIIVIEASDNLTPTKAEPRADGSGAGQVTPAGEAQSWRLLRWSRQNGLSQASPVATGKIILGFAIWKDRKGYSTPLLPDRIVRQTWGDWLWSS